MRRFLGLAAMAAALIGLPLLGVWASGGEVGRYLEFPPRTLYVAHAPFSWAGFGLTGAFILAWVVPVGLSIVLWKREEAGNGRQRRPFPVFGWLGLALGAAGWLAAWTRHPALEALQPHTFTPLWLAYVLVVNAWTMQRSGRCPLVDQPGPYLLLFPASALFWWFFEYLNRFVQTWYYVGSGDLTPLQYAFRASLAFSTVLPASWATWHLLATVPRLTAPFARWPALRLPWPRAAAALVLGAAGAGLALVGRFPDALHGLLWVSPVLFIVAAQALAGVPTLLDGVARGDWRRVWGPALAALACGLFWELWNVWSLAKWIYDVPYVHRFLVFEMPLLGYAGYLPFGLECAVVAHLVSPELREPFEAQSPSGWGPAPASGASSAGSTPSPA